MQKNGQSHGDDFDAYKIVEQLCEAYETSLIDGRATTIEELVEASPPHCRERVLQELLLIEFSHLSRQSHDIDRDRYCRRFPQHTEVVDSAWREHTSRHANSATASFAFSSGNRDDRKRAAAPRDEHQDSQNERAEAERDRWQAELSGRFQLGVSLGAGGMACVYQATDCETGQEVALKVMRSNLEGAAQRRFSREFNAIASVDHPNCIRVHQFGETALGPYFTMELFTGEPISDLTPCALAVKLDAIFQAANAIDYVHSCRIVHRDIKPSNMLAALIPGENNRLHCVVKLADFGLAKFSSMSTSLSRDAGFVGTVAYASPEQIINETYLDHRADLYSFGVLCYELLSGEHPFVVARDAGIHALLRAHLQTIPTPLADRCPELPADIAAVVDAMLAKSPRERPSSTETLRRALAPYLAGDYDVTEFRRPHSETLTNDLGFVCREVERQRVEDVILKNAFAARARREFPAEICLVSGEPGIGKSFLLREVMRTAMAHGCHIYEGRCYQGNRGAFQPFVDVLRQILQEHQVHHAPDRKRSRTDSQGSTDPLASTTFLQADPNVNLGPVLDHYSAQILCVGPELERFLPGRATLRRNDLFAEADYLYRMIATLFVEISQHQPTVLFIDDIQWADPSSLDLLLHLATAIRRERDANPRDVKVLPQLSICCTARSGYDELDNFLEEASPQRLVENVALQAFARDELRELIALRLRAEVDDVSPDLTDRIHQLCEGNPFFASETIRQWRTIHSIQFVDDEWVYRDTDSSQAGQLPSSVRESLADKLKHLDDATRRVLVVAAILGKACDINLLDAATSDLSDYEFDNAIDELLSRGIFVETAQVREIRFAHDLLWEITLENVSHARQRKLHRHVADVYEQRLREGMSVSFAVLANHYRNAAIGEKAFHYLVEAGRTALRSFAVEAAVEHLDAATEVMPEDTKREAKYDCWSLLAKARFAAHDSQEAIDAHHQALEWADSSLQRAEEYSGIQLVLQCMADYDAAIEIGDKALAELGERRPRRLIRILWDVQLAIAQIVFPWLRGRRDTSRRSTLRAKIYDGLGKTLVHRNTFPAFQANARATIHALTSADEDDFAALINALGWGGMASSAGGLHVIGRATTRQIRALSPTRDEDVALGRGWIGSIAYCSGRLTDAHHDLEAALESLSQSSSNWSTFWFCHANRHTYNLLGDARREIEAGSQEVRVAEANRDPAGVGWGLYGLASGYALNGDFAESERCCRESLQHILVTKSFVTTSIALTVYASLQVQASHHHRALLPLQLSRDLGVRSLGIVYDYLAVLYPTWLEAVLGPHWERPAERQVLRAARRLKRACQLHRWLHPNMTAFCHRTAGRLAMASGRQRRAIRLFGKAIDVARRSNIRYQLAKALLDLAGIQPAEADALRREAVEILRESAAVIPESEAWSLGEYREQADDIVAPTTDLGELPDDLVAWVRNLTSEVTWFTYSPHADKEAAK